MHVLCGKEYINTAVTEIVCKKSLKSKPDLESHWVGHMQFGLIPLNQRNVEYLCRYVRELTCEQLVYYAMSAGSDRCRDEA